MKWFLAGVALAATAGVASAQVPPPAEAAQVAAQAEDAAPAVDPRDLPPLPQVVLEDRVGGVALVSASQTEEDVVVGASKREQSLGNVASAVTVISADRLRRFGYRTVAEALRGVAGLYLVNDRMSSRLGIRGLQLLGDFNTRILVLVDGATVNEPWNQFAGIGWDMPVSLDEVARIEVIRGPVSSVYGTNAFFGIINIVTRSAEQSPRAYGRTWVGGLGGVSGSAGFALGDVNQQVRGNFSFLSSGGEDVTIGDFDTSADGERAFQGSLVGHYQGGFVQLRGYDRRRELAGAPYDTAPGDARNQNTDRHFMAEGGYSRDVGTRLTVTGRGYFNRYQFQDYLVYEPDDANFRDVGDSTWFGGELRGRWALLGASTLGLTTGVETTRQITKSKSFYEGMEADAALVPKSFTLVGLYAELDTAPTPWLSATGGVRFDYNSTLTDKVSPRAALFYHQGEEYGAKLLYAQGFRNPSAYEGFFEDGVDFVGNPAIKPETITSYELVLWGRPIAGVNARVSGFHWALADLIEQEEIDVDVGGGMTEQRLQFQNVAEASSSGVEVELSYRDTRGWFGFVHGSFAEVKFQRAGEASETGLNAPRVVGGLGVSTPLLWRRVHLSTELDYVSARQTRDPTLTADPWLGWNVAAVVPDYRGFELTVGVRNLLGVREDVPVQEDYDRDDGATLVPVMPGEGRELYARVGYRY